MLTALMVVRAVRTDLPHFPARVVVTPADAPHRFRGVERREETADDQVYADHGPSAAALRPPASASRPPHRRRDHRHRPRRPSRDGAWLASTAQDDQLLLEQEILRDHGSRATGATQLRNHDGQVQQAEQEVLHARDSVR